MASIDAILNVVVAGSTKIDQIINKINQLGGVIDAINKSPIDLSVSAAEAEIKKFNNAVFAIGKNLKTAEKSVDAATAKIERYQKAYEAAEKAIAAANSNTKKYEQAIERRRKANEGLIASLAELKQAEELIGKIDSSGALENAENRKKEAQEAARLTKQINTLSEQYLKYGEAQKRASGGQFAGPAPKTISQLNAQAQALALIASNSEVATAAFNRFTLAAELAGQATYYAQQEQLKAISSGLSAEAPGVSFGRGSIAAARSQVQEFVNSYAALTKSEAAMSAFVTQAQRLKSLLPDTVKEFTMLEEIISKASEDLKSIGSIGKIKVQLDIDEERLNRLSQLARRRGAPEAYSIQAGPLPEGERGGARYFAERVEIAEELLKIEKEIIAVQKEFADTRSAEDKKAEENAKRRLEIYKNIKKTASNVGDVLFDATTFGKSSEIKKTIGEITKGARNALVRGGLGLGALGLGGLYEGIGNLKNVDLGGISWGKLNIDYNAIKGPIGAAAKAIGEPINNALQGIPEIIGNFLSALGDIPGALGLAAVAAYAFAPAMKTAADAVFLAGQKFGESNFGQNIKLTLDRQTNIFEEVINAASEMNMALDTSKSGLDAVGQAVRSLPALPAAGQTSFKGEVRRGRSGGFIGGGARELLNAEYLSTFKEGDYLPNLKEISQQTKTLASRSDEAAQATLMFAEKLSDAANDLDVTREATFRLSQELADAKTAFEAFRLENFAQSANAYSKAVLNINQVFRDYVAAGGKGLDVTTQQSQAYIDAANSAKEYAKSVNAVRDVSKDTGLLGYEGIESPAERLRRIQRAQESMGLQPVQAPSLALRPAGFTDQDVRIKNSLDNLAQYEQRLNKIVSDGQLELLQIQLSAELDNIETITAAQKAADDARWAREAKRLEALPDIADVRRRPISFMTPQERGVLPTEGGGLRLSDGNILDPASLRADRRRRVQTLKARKEAGGRALSEGLIGGAFPLLFGQGLGASIGGLAGGVGGGFAGGGLGFGLSLVGTALGTALDQLGAKAVETGKALRDPIAGLEKLKEANLLASKSQEYYIQKLIETGRASQATAIIQSEIIKKIGVSGVNDLNKLAKSSDELSKAWAEFNLQLQVALAGPMTGLLQWITGVVGAFNQAGRFKSDVENIRSGLTPEQRAKFDKEKLGASVKRYQTLEQQMAAEQKIIEKYRAMAVIKAPSLTADPAQIEQQRKAAQQTADEIKQAYRSAFNLQRQAIDIEIQATDNRRKVEEDIFRKRQEIARSEADNARTAAQIRIESADLAMRKGFIGAEGEAKTILEAVRNFVKIRSEGEADIEKKRRDLEATMSDIQRETSNYLYEQAKVRMQMERSIEDYKMNVADYQLETQRKIQNLQEIAQAGVNSGDFSIANIASKKLTPKEKALLATIRFAEGTSGANGYNTMFGGGTFSDLSRHPDRVIRANGRASAAAGAYQFMPDTWNKTLGGGSMAPARQDAGALSLILRRGVDVNKTGFTPQIANKLAPEWASFPTLSGKSYYNQPVKSFNALNSYYQKALKQFEKESGAPSAVKTGQMVGGLPVQQLEQAGAMIRPVGPSLDVNTEGMVASQKRLGQLAKDRLGLERELNRIGVDTAKLGIFEAARGESNIIALSNQLDLERSKYQVISQSANLGKNEIDLLIKKKEGESAISLIKDYQAQAIATINKSVSEGNMKQDVAKEAIAAINRGVEERLVFTKQQQQLEEAILELNQKQAFAEKLANVERQTALAGLEYDLGYAGESASAFREAFDLTNSIQQAQQYADAVQRLESLPGLKTKKFVAEAVAELNDLEALTIRVSQSIGDAVGNSLNEGITGLIEGTTTAEQVFADFLRNIGQILIQEGAKIIATYIAIGIAKAFAGLAGGATGGPKSDPVTNFNLAASQYGFADGGVFSGNKLTAFANGGIVDSPTLFKFADGGAMQAGVMGEAGPEAIMPLQRDANGRLGVKATGVVEALAAARGALSDGQSKGTSDPFAENRQALGGISSVERERNVERIISSGASSTEIKYSRVGSGDLPFVTEEDMLQATRVAAQEGAKLGQQRTLAALKNNPGTRRTIGI